jgi:hypothetical protein
MSSRAHRTAAILTAFVLLTGLPVIALAARPIDARGKPTRPSPTPTPTPASATLHWSGHDWDVKHHSRKIGPGPNFFSSANVRLVGDALQLKLTRSGNRWYAAEVISRDSFGYGRYEWQVAPIPGPLDPNVVLGLFTWNDDPAYNHREIDFEYARWGNASDPNNAQYVVQPYSTSGNEHRFAHPRWDVTTIHSFTWYEDHVEFESRALDGSWSYEWDYRGPDVPVPGGENARMNLWLFRGAAPTNGQPVSITLERFTHTPLADLP